MPIGGTHRRRLVGPTEHSRLDRLGRLERPTVTVTAMTTRARDTRSDMSHIIMLDASDANGAWPCRLSSPLLMVHRVTTRESSASELATDSTCESSRVPI